MNIYDRIINILLEARIEDYLERVDELIGNQSKLDLNKSGKLDSQDFKMLRRGIRGKMMKKPKRADEARYESGKKIGPGPKKGGMSSEVKAAIRQGRFEDETGISPAKSEDARQKKHAETHGRGAPGRAIRARGRRQVESTMPTKPKRTGGIILNPKKEISKKKMDYKTPPTVPSKKGNKPS